MRNLRNYIRVIGSTLCKQSMFIILYGKSCQTVNKIIADHKAPWNNNRFTVANRPTDWATLVLEVMGSRPSFREISEIQFLESIQSPAQRDFKWSVWHCGNLMWPVAGEKLPCYQDGPLYIIPENAVTRTHIHLHTYTSWWLVIGWVTTKLNHPCLRIAYMSYTWRIVKL